MGQCECCGCYGDDECTVCRYKECTATDANCISLLIDESRGIYIPQDFAAESEGWGLSDEDKQILAAGPYHEYYWDVWDDVLSYATYERRVGDVVETWILDQDCDLWARLVSIEPVESTGEQGGGGDS